MDGHDSSCWELPERLTVDTVSALFHERAEKLAAIRSFDLSAVREMDSAGVALLHWFRSRQRDLGLIPAQITGELEARYQALCTAHRIPDTQEPEA